jgi:hypothetical protein
MYVKIFRKPTQIDTILFRLPTQIAKHLLFLGAGVRGRRLAQWEFTH